MKSVDCNKRDHEAGQHEAEAEAVVSRGRGHCHRGRGQFFDLEAEAGPRT